MSLFDERHGIEHKSDYFKLGYHDGFIGYICDPPDDAEIYQNEYLSGYRAGNRKKEAIKDEP